MSWFKETCETSLHFILHFFFFGEGNRADVFLWPGWLGEALLSYNCNGACWEVNFLGQGSSSSHSISPVAEEMPTLKYRHDLCYKKKKKEKKDTNLKVSGISEQKYKWEELRKEWEVFSFFIRIYCLHLQWIHFLVCVCVCVVLYRTI